MLRTFFLRKKYNKNIDDIFLKDENPEPEKWSLFVIVGIYSSGTYLTLKGRLVPEETTTLAYNISGISDALNLSTFIN